MTPNTRHRNTPCTRCPVHSRPYGLACLWQARCGASLPQVIRQILLKPSLLRRRRSRRGSRCCALFRAPAAAPPAQSTLPRTRRHAVVGGTHGHPGTECRTPVYTQVHSDAMMQQTNTRVRTHRYPPPTHTQTSHESRVALPLRSRGVARPPRGCIPRDGEAARCVWTRSRRGRARRICCSCRNRGGAPWRLRRRRRAAPARHRRRVPGSPRRGRPPHARGGRGGRREAEPHPVLVPRDARARGRELLAQRLDVRGQRRDLVVLRARPPPRVRAVPPASGHARQAIHA